MLNGPPTLREAPFNIQHSTLPLPDPGIVDVVEEREHLLHPGAARRVGLTTELLEEGELDALLQLGIPAITLEKRELHIADGRSSTSERADELVGAGFRL